MTRSIGGYQPRGGDGPRGEPPHMGSGGRPAGAARDPIRDLIDSREQTHGDFADVAQLSQRLKSALRDQPDWVGMNNRFTEALEMIAVKIARIVCGNTREPDHWRDIAGYARLILDYLEADNVR